MSANPTNPTNPTNPNQGDTMTTAPDAQMNAGDVPQTLAAVPTSPTWTR